MMSTEQNSSPPIQFHSERFGHVSANAEDVLHFVKPILGFDHLSQYVLLDHEPDSPFKWLQSVEDGALAFVVTNPTLFGIEYDFILPEDACSLLDIHQAEQAQVLTLVTVPPEAPIKMTANLLGPIVYNTETLKAMQVILNPEQYSTKVRLISDEEISEEHQSNTSQSEAPASSGQGE